MTRPYNKPDIESHDDSQPHSDSDGGVSGIGFCSEVDERFDEVSVKRSENDSRCQRCERSPTEPEERGGSDDFSDGGFLLCGNFWHGWNLHEVEIPQQADPHDSACDMGPAEEEGYVFACSSANISELREQQREQNEENRSCEDGSMKAGEDGGHIKFSGQFLILLLGGNNSVFRRGMQVFFGKFFLKKPVKSPSTYSPLSLRQRFSRRLYFLCFQHRVADSPLQRAFDHARKSLPCAHLPKVLDA